jgi:mRNA-degrading endonuclease RelE of RelBE toxin-antitoxin system
MGNYFIEISPAAEKDLTKLKDKIPNFNELISVIDDLSIEPKPYAVRKKDIISIFYCMAN